MQRVEIDIYSDFMCPWCFIGSRRLYAALESFADLVLVTRHHPYLLYPNAPFEGLDLRASLAQRYGQSPESPSVQSRRQHDRSAFRSTSPKLRVCIRPSTHTRSLEAPIESGSAASSLTASSLHILWKVRTLLIEMSWWISRFARGWRRRRYTRFSMTRARVDAPVMKRTRQYSQASEALRRSPTNQSWS